MFKIEYKMVYSEFDDFKGQNGFLQIVCNEYKYGQIYPEQMKEIMDMDIVSLVDWFERLVRVIKHLKDKNYVVLSDIESYNTWIEFFKEDENVFISVVESEKKDGTHDIEFELNKPFFRIWERQAISYSELKTEIISKTKEYLESNIFSNIDNHEIKKLKEIYNYVIAL